jgi:hypothetical protein
MKRLTFSVAAALCGLWTAPCALAQPKLSTNEPVYQSGNWFVVRTTKERSDVVACTGFYKSYRGIQLTQDTLIVKVTDDMQSVAIGFGDKMRAPRPPEDIEKEMRAVVFKGASFDQLRRAKRLKLEVLTTKGSSLHDLKLQGLNGALENIAAGCPEPDQPLRKKAQGAAESCSAPLMARMRANGITEAQIEASCR